MIKKTDLKLVPHNDPVLYKEPDLFDFNGSQNAEMFANIMLDRMTELGGIGLSANQVGVNYKMFVMGINDVQLAVFNPVINSCSEEVVSLDEGCLSFPGVYVKVSRPVSINVTYQNYKGETVNQELSGLTARVFLHEYDHMIGKTFKDRVSKLKWDLANKRVVKRTKKIIKKYTQKQLVSIANQVKDQYGDDSSRVS